MTTKTFNRNGTSLTDGMNWTPTGVPQPGDTAIMSTGFGILGGSNLNGDTLLFGKDLLSPPNQPPPTLVLWDSTLNLATLGSGQGTVIAEDHSTLNVTNVQSAPSASLTVDIPDGDQLQGTLPAINKATVTVNGRGAVYDHTGSTFVGLGGNAVLNTNVLGTGDWTVADLGSISVSGRFDQTITFSPGGHLDLKTPTLFTGQLNMSSSTGFTPVSEATLDGLFATAATYQGGTLSLLFGTQVIDQVKIAAPGPFTVVQGPTGVQIFGGDPPTPVPVPQVLLHT